jgi:hypothetical protein
MNIFRKQAGENKTQKEQDQLKSAFIIEVWVLLRDPKRYIWNTITLSLEMI